MSPRSLGWHRCAQHEFSWFSSQLCSVPPARSNSFMPSGPVVSHCSVSLISLPPGSQSLLLLSWSCYTTGCCCDYFKKASHFYFPGEKIGFLFSSRHLGSNWLLGACWVLPKLPDPPQVATIVQYSLHLWFHLLVIKGCLENLYGSFIQGDPKKLVLFWLIVG